MASTHIDMEAYVMASTHIALEESFVSQTQEICTLSPQMLGRHQGEARNAIPDMDTGPNVDKRQREF